MPPWLTLCPPGKVHALASQNSTVAVNVGPVLFAGVAVIVALWLSTIELVNGVVVIGTSALPWML